MKIPTTKLRFKDLTDADAPFEIEDSTSISILPINDVGTYTLQNKNILGVLDEVMEFDANTELNYSFPLPIDYLKITATNGIILKIVYTKG